MVKITSKEATSLRDFIEFNLLDAIRNDVEIDSLLWVYNILNVYRKCGGLKEYDDYEGEKE
jgi:hypothetical protein